jgi:hypothetical protein
MQGVSLSCTSDLTEGLSKRGAAPLTDEKARIASLRFLVTTNLISDPKIVAGLQAAEKTNNIPQFKGAVITGQGPGDIAAFGGQVRVSPVFAPDGREAIFFRNVGVNPIYIRVTATPPCIPNVITLLPSPNKDSAANDSSCVVEGKAPATFSYTISSQRP